jgi:hypothetical protein
MVSTLDSRSAAEGNCTYGDGAISDGSLKSPRAILPRASPVFRFRFAQKAARTECRQVWCGFCVLHFAGTGEPDGTPAPFRGGFRQFPIEECLVTRRSLWVSILASSAIKTFSAFHRSSDFSVTVSGNEAQHILI